MKLFKIFCALVLISNLSCSIEKEYDYYIHNQTGSECLVLLSVGGGPGLPSTLRMPAGDRQKFLVVGKGLGEVNDYQKDNDLMKDVNSLSIFKNDTILAKTNFLKTSCWQYQKKKRRKAEYTLNITDADF